MVTKECIRCKQQLPLEKFYALRQWYAPRCKPCTAILAKEKYDRQPYSVPSEEFAKCKCGETDPSMFYRSNRSKRGYMFQCKACYKAKNYTAGRPKRKKTDYTQIARDMCNKLIKEHDNVKQEQST